MSRAALSIIMTNAWSNQDAKPRASFAKCLVNAWNEYKSYIG